MARKAIAVMQEQLFLKTVSRCPLLLTLFTTRCGISDSTTNADSISRSLARDNPACLSLVRFLKVEELLLPDHITSLAR